MSSTERQAPPVGTVDVPRAPSDRRRRAGFAAVAAVLATMMFAASAPTPLYAEYSATWRFSAVHLTAVFAVYAIVLLATLLVAGPASDAVGRRPFVLAGLALQVVAMLLFVSADGLAQLYAARSVQGVATGLTMATTAAALIDLQPRRGVGALVNSVTPLFGLAAGTLGAGALVQYAPAPTRLVYDLVLVVCLALGVAVVRMPEPVADRRRPHLGVRLGVEPAVRRTFRAVAPCLVATWALGGFYLSLGPSLSLVLLESGNRLAGSAATAVLCGAGGAAALAVRSWPAPRTMVAGCGALVLGAAVTLAGIATSGFGLFLAGSAVAGVGFGTAFLGAFRTLAALATPDHRAELVSAVYVVNYVAISVPAVVAGAVSTVVGLRATALGYGAAVALLAAAAAAATVRATGR